MSIRLHEPAPQQLYASPALQKLRPSSVQVRFCTNFQIYTNSLANSDEPPPLAAPTASLRVSYVLPIPRAASSTVALAATVPNSSTAPDSLGVIAALMPNCTTVPDFLFLKFSLSCAPKPKNVSI
ncbi:hypothetical protein VNO80_01189 [Phaseolus coccineus]|uniref:Uncharacterized protein n=1 Tax=Phaseolus coccineus TaxID=3886 RepID=A0AAN9RSI7_PHACN